MLVAESINTALGTIRANKLRAFLTLLSISIGVFSIISVMTSLGALQSSIESGLSQLGANTFQVQKYPNNHGGGPGWRERFRNRKDLTYQEGLAVVEKTSGAKHVGLEVWKFGVDVSWKNVRTDPNVSIAGESPDGLPTNQWEVEFGRGLSQSDLDLTRHVVVLGSDLVKLLFPPNINPIGEKVRMMGKTYTVIGTLKARGGMFGNQDRYFIIPITTFFENFGKSRSIHIMVQSRTRENFESTMDEVIGVLRAARNVPAGEENDFAIFSNESLIKEFNEVTASVKLGTLAIAGVALLAAGIGIMNIMLVSVTERTREIGIRKAVGANRKNIVSQFLSEAVIISVFGGVIGIALGLLAGNIMAFMLDIPGIVQPGWVIFGLVTCTVIGILFGTYPAWKASNLDPIEALRFE